MPANRPIASSPKIPRSSNVNPRRRRWASLLRSQRRSADVAASLSNFLEPLTGDECTLSSRSDPYIWTACFVDSRPFGAADKKARLVSIH